MAIKKERDDPSQWSPARSAMADDWVKMRAVLGGTKTMREAGETLLPRYEREGEARYQSRLASSFLYNATDITLGSWVGKVFGEPLKYAGSPYHDAERERQQSTGLVIPEMPVLDPKITSLFPDIDLTGNCIDVFAREWFKTGISYAVAPMMVFQSQAKSTPAPGTTRTKLDDQKEKLRPYWRNIAPENILDARTEERNGRQVFTHVRVLSSRPAYDGFVTEEVPRILVYEPGKVTYWEIVKKRATRSDWGQVGEDDYDYDEVPLVVFYADKLGTMEGRSPLFDLADVNVRHWQSYSSQANCLEVARFPMLAGAGVPEEQEVIVGNRRFLRSELPEARFYYVEHGGAALASGESDLKRLEEWMSAYGSDFLKKKVSHVTAADTQISNASATSPISDVACRFNDSLATALYHTAKWMRLQEPAPSSLTVKSEFNEVPEGEPGAGSGAPGSDKPKMKEAA